MQIPRPKFHVERMISKSMEESQTTNIGTTESSCIPTPAPTPPPPMPYQQQQQQSQRQQSPVPGSAQTTIRAQSMPIVTTVIRQLSSNNNNNNNSSNATTPPILPMILKNKANLWLFLNHCQKEFSIENVISFIEFYQFLNIMYNSYFVPLIFNETTHQNSVRMKIYEILTKYKLYELVLSEINSKLKFQNAGQTITCSFVCFALFLFCVFTFFGIFIFIIIFFFVGLGSIHMCHFVFVCEVFCVVCCARMHAHVFLGKK